MTLLGRGGSSFDCIYISILDKYLETCVSTKQISI
jgi:hypothetical protein